MEVTDWAARGKQDFASLPRWSKLRSPPPQVGPPAAQPRPPVPPPLGPREPADWARAGPGSGRGAGAAGRRGPTWPGPPPRAPRAGTWRALRQAGGGAPGVAGPRSASRSRSRTFPREVPHLGEGARRGEGRAEFLEAAAAAPQHGLLRLLCGGRRKPPSTFAGERRAALLPVAAYPAVARGAWGSGRAGGPGGGARKPQGRCPEPRLSGGAERRAGGPGPCGWCRTEVAAPGRDSGS